MCRSAVPIPTTLCSFMRKLDQKSIMDSSFFLGGYDLVASIHQRLLNLARLPHSSQHLNWLEGGSSAGIAVFSAPIWFQFWQIPNVLWFWMA